MLALYARSPPGTPLIIRAPIVHWAFTRSKLSPKDGRFLEVYDLLCPGMYRALSTVPADRCLNYNPALLGIPNCEVSRIIPAVGLTACQNPPDTDRDAPLIPASTIKLITSAAVFMRLPPHHCFHAKLHSNAPLQNGILEGDLSPQGPVIPVPMIEEVWSLARLLRQREVQRVQGSLIGDDTCFDAELAGRGWADDRNRRADRVCRQPAW
jgi:hypothetical protein